MRKSYGRKWTLAIMVSALGLAGADNAWAQAVRAAPAAGELPRTGASTNPASRQGQSMDHYFASCLILENDNEIQAANMAEKKAESSDVKKLAAMMAKDHEKFVKELERFAGGDLRTRRNEQRADGRDDSRRGSGAAGAGAAPRRDTARPQPGTTGAATSPRAASASPNGNPIDEMMQIKHEIADQCLASAERELSSKSGSEFDECYVGMQLAAHMHMADTLTVLERHASPELQPVLREGLETVQKHLEHAKQVMKNLKDDDAEKTARKDSKSSK